VAGGRGLLARIDTMTRRALNVRWYKYVAEELNTILIYQFFPLIFIYNYVAM
jgi:hypothetical protein